MATQIDIYNLALFKLAQSIKVPAITDRSKAADVLNTIWEPMRDLVLAERVWPWAVRSQALAVDIEPEQPGWAYRYSYPNDCLSAYAVTNAAGLAVAGRLSRFADGDYIASVWGSGAFDWDTSYGEQSTTINTNVRDAYLVYACRVEDVGRYPPQFVNALACRLAAEAAPPIIGEVGLNNKAQLLQEYQLALTTAGAHAMNEAKSDADYVTPSVAARGQLMPKFLQPSLSGGELSPGMRGRVDLARFSISLGRARNFITKPTGGGAKRNGTLFRGRVKFSNKRTRIIPFIYSTTVKYLIEMGDSYLRFWVNGALLTNAQKPVQGISKASPAVVTSAAHGYVNGDNVVISGVRGMTKVNSRTFTVAGATSNTFQLAGFDSSSLVAYAGGGSVDRIVEVATPYDEAKLRGVRLTQSADVLYLVHGQVPQKELRRLSVNAFELRDFAFKRGPFRPFNSDESLIMAVSGTTGVVTASTNVDTFTADMVGSLLYVEEKELRGVKPWASAEKGVPVGALRRSDSKVYRCVSVPANIGSKGTPYWVAGNVRPVHDSGRAFDGPQDVKDDGVNSYAVGVEWEFLHNTFGILQIQSYTDARHVQAVVIERVPDSIVGTAPAPSNSWTLSGDGVTKVFTIAGATSGSALDYRVSINGQPTQSNPFYPGGGGVGGGGGGNPRPGNGNTQQQEI